MAGRSCVCLLLILASLGSISSKKEECDAPSGLDSVPIISQIKSLVQLIGGHKNAARCTQENFSKGAPIVSQLRSAVEAGKGDTEAARKTQKFFLDNVVQTAEATPGIGHIIGGIQLAKGDKERGEETLKSASRSTAVILGGIAGGPAGAVGAGVAFDGIASAAGKKPYGIVDTIKNIDEVSKNPGQAFDAIVGTALDAFATPGKKKGGGGKNKDGESSDSGSKKDGDKGGTNVDEGHSDNTRFGSSPKDPDAMDFVSNPSRPNRDHINELVSRRESWEDRRVNDFGLDDNCYYCTVAALRGKTVDQMITLLEEMQMNGGAKIPEIKKLFQDAGYKDVALQRFDNGNQLHNFLHGELQPGTWARYGLAYKTVGDDGHMVVMRAWKTTEGILGYRLIDFQQEPNSPNRISENKLPDRTNYLFYLGEGIDITDAMSNLRITGPVKTKDKSKWLSLDQIALSGPIQFVGKNSTFGLSTNFQDNPNKDLLENGKKNVPIDENVVFTAGCAAPAYQCGKKIIGYYTSWGSRYFTVYHAQRLTHVIFAFMKMNADGTASDDLRKDELDRLERLMRVKKYFNHLNVMFAVGGWDNSQYFSAMASSPSGRQKFISSLISIIDKWGFNGVDIDWEYPVTGGAQEGVSSDKENYVQFMSDLRKALDAKRPGYLISFASAAGQWTLQPGFDLPGLLKYANWVNVMTYDYFGAWESQWGAFTGPPSPLFYGAPKKWSGKLNVDWTMRYYACRLEDPNKIVMGVPFYGRYWKNVGPPYNETDGMWRLALAVNGRTEGGAAPFYEMKEKYLNDASYQRTYQNVAKAPYLWNPSKSIYFGYEDEESLKAKVDYAVSKNLGGIMIWAVDQDDDKLSLLNVVYQAPLCTSSNAVNFKCSPIKDKRWWTWDDDKQKAGMCGKSAPLYKDYYPVCDPEDEGYSCCGAFGYCGSGPDFCDCPTCTDYGNHPEKVIEQPVKPTGPIRWYLNNDEDGKRGRCGRDIPKLNGEYPICNPDDPNAHCCSNGFYCGSGPASCDCEGCVDFKKNPNYKFKEKTWFDWGDGPEKSGTCGPSAERLNGKVAECNPDSKWPCCSEFGNCGDSDEHCKCSKCVDYRKK